jgi:putative transposase
MARQVRWAKRHNRGRYSRRLRRTITRIARRRARQVRRRLDFTHKRTTDLAKSHGVAARLRAPVRLRRMARPALGRMREPLAHQVA